MHRSFIHSRAASKTARLFLFVLAAVALAQAPAPSAFRFVLLGDRTGEAQPGVWDQVWKEIAAEKPAFVVGVGDTIEGGDDATAEAEWRAIKRPRIPLYLAPGNHDVWSEASARLFEKYAGHPLHYSFDYGAAHFTILDNSRSDDFSAEEMTFLESDLERHGAQPLKFVISHRPSWLVDAALRNTASKLHQLARKYGVGYFVAGHVHQMLHVVYDGVTYISLPSAGGHLRASGEYQDGWFFGYTVVTVKGATASFEIHSWVRRTARVARPGWRIGD